MDVNMNMVGSPLGDGNDALDRIEQVQEQIIIWVFPTGKKFEGMQKFLTLLARESEQPGHDLEFSTQ